MIDRYSYFFEETFLNEGYFQNDPNDAGNYYNGKLYGTIAGITSRDHFKEFTIANQLYGSGKTELLKKYCMDFYRKKGYWNESFNEIADSSLAFKLFDLSVNMGKTTSIKLLQKTLIKHFDSDLIPNGDLDSKTLEEANTAYLRPSNKKYVVEPVLGESVLYACYIHEAKKYYKSLKGFGKFGSGWLRRLATIFNKTPDKVDLAINARPPERIKSV